MKCVKCGQEIQPEAVFCDQCGVKVEKKIHCQCGNVLSVDARFCGKCGKKVDDKAQTIHVEENTQLGNEIKQTTPQFTKPYILNENHYGKQIPVTSWIIGLRISSYIGFLATVILGIYQWVKLADYGKGGLGFSIFLICVIAGFLGVSAIMIYLDIAKDIRKIRQLAEKK